MIKVLQIRETPESKSDGLEANVQGLISLLGHDSCVEMIPTVNYTRHTIPLIYQYYLDKKEIIDSINKYNPDIVHIHGAYSFTLPVAINCAKACNKTIVLSLHFHPFWSLRRPLMGKLFFYLITKNILKKADCVFTINNEDTSIISQYTTNVVKIPHWSKFDNRKKNEIEKKANMILFVGRIDETNKGFEHLLHLPEGLYDIHCVGKGTIPSRKDFHQHINITDDALHRLYREASLLVVPSRYEAFSYVALEALLCNTPVVMSDRVRIADHLNGVCGYSVFKYQDYENFVSTVKKTICMQVEVQKVYNLFSPEVIKEKYISEYKKLIHLTKV